MGNNHNKKSEKQKVMGEANVFIGEEIPALPELKSPSEIIDRSHVEKLHVLVPGIVTGSDWIRLFSTEKDGFSLRTLYTQLEPYTTPVILAIKDNKGAVFGALLSDVLEQSKYFYGSVKSCLYTFHPEFRVFKGTGRNKYYIKGNVDSFAIGDGDGKFGLWVDADLDRGRCQQCLTFENDLLSSSEDFHIVSLEVWGFQCVIAKVAAVAKGAAVAASCP